MQSVRAVRAVRVFTLLAVTSLAGACGGRSEDASAAVTAAPTAPTALSASLRAVGVACASGYQCVSGACSVDAAVGEGCGVCLEVRALGARCDASLVTCSTSAVCHDGICRSTKQTIGQPCHLGGKGDSQDCDDELRCVGESEEGTCVHRALIGEACGNGPFDDCAFNAQCERGLCLVPRLGMLGDTCERRSCGPGLACYRSAESHTCQVPSVLPVNAACDGDLIGTTDCAKGTSCELVSPPGADGQLACVADRTEGQECASSRCAEGLFCNESAGETTYRCAPLLREGEPCSSTSCAADLECRGGQCRPACR